MRCRCCGQKIDAGQVSSMELWTFIESKILRELESGEIVSRDKLVKRVYDMDVEGYKHADAVRNKVSVHVSRIRDKLERHSVPWRVVNKWGRGYFLKDAAA
jgi:DNA-binding response OmpR family regulator